MPPPPPPPGYICNWCRLHLCQVAWNCFSCDCVHYCLVRVFTFCSYILLLVIATCSLRVTCGGSLQNAMQINILSSVLNSVRYNLGTLYMLLQPGGLAWRIRNRACMCEKKSRPFHLQCMTEHWWFVPWIMPTFSYKLTCRQKKRSADKFDSSDPSYCQFLIKLQVKL